MCLNSLSRRSALVLLFLTLASPLVHAQRTDGNVRWISSTEASPWKEMPVEVQTWLGPGTDPPATVTLDERTTFQRIDGFGSCFNDLGWLDAGGHGHSEDLRVQERFTRRDFGHVDVAVTIVDPKMFTKPFTITFAERLLPDTDVFEHICLEDEKDVAHIPK